MVQLLWARRREMMVRIGNFLFHYRNGLFPLAFVLLLVPGRRIFASDLMAAGVGVAVALVGQILRAVTIGLAYIKRGGKDRQVYAETLVVEEVPDPAPGRGERHFRPKHARADHRRLRFLCRNAITTRFVSLAQRRLRDADEFLPAVGLARHGEGDAHAHRHMPAVRRIGVRDGERPDRGTHAGRQVLGIEPIGVCEQHRELDAAVAGAEIERPPRRARTRPGRPRSGRAAGRTSPTWG